MLDAGFYKSLTYNAREWADIMQRDVQREKSELYAVVLAEIIRKVPAIIINNLKLATAGHAEYGRYQWMTDDIAKLVRENAENMVAVNERTGRVEIRDGMELFLGTWEDYDAGVAAAREAIREDLELSDKPITAAQKAAFWRNKVWPSDYWYPRTMRYRRDFWGEDKAPWWLWLDAGNVGRAGAYPQAEGTNFVFMAKEEIQELFDLTLDEKVIEATNYVAEATDRFLDDPEAFRPYDVLEEFYAEGKLYKIYVTPTGRIGVAQRTR